jgi:hypothetical protein
LSIILFPCNMLGSCLLMSPGFSGYVASERDASCHFRLSLGPDVDIELVSADAERFAGGVAGERRVSSSSSLTGADQTLSSYLKSPIAFSDDWPARDRPFCTLTLSGVGDISSPYRKTLTAFSDQLQARGRFYRCPLSAVSEICRAHIQKLRLLSQTIDQ